MTWLYKNKRFDKDLTTLSFISFAASGDRNALPAVLQPHTYIRTLPAMATGHHVPVFWHIRV